MKRLSIVIVAACGSGEGGPPPVLFSGNVLGNNLAVVGGRVLFSTFGEGEGIRVMDDRGGGLSLVVPDARIAGFGLGVASNQLVWPGSDAGQPINGICTAPVTGGDCTQIAQFSTGSAIEAFVVTPDAVFAANFDQILQVSLVDQTSTTIGTVGSTWLDVRGNRLVSSHASRQVSIDLVTKVETELSLLNTRARFALDDDAMYIPEGGDIVRVPFDGSSQTRTPVATANPEQVIRRPGELIVATEFADVHHAIVRIPDGGAEEVLFDDIRIDSPTMVIDGDTLYAAYCCNDPESTSNGQVIRLEL